MNNNRNNPENKGAKKPLDSKLITIIIAAVAVVVLIALLVPTIIALNKNGEKVDSFNAQLEEMKDRLSKFEVNESVTAEELQNAISEAIAGIKIPEGGLTEEQVKAIIDAAIAGIEIPEAGLTEEQVKAIIDAAIAGIDMPAAGLTEEQVKEIINNAIAGIDTGLTEEQIKEIINEAIGKIEIPEAGLTAEEIKAIVDEAIAGIDMPEAGLTEEQIRDIINEALEGIEPGLSAEEIKAIIDEALAGLDKGLTEEQIRDIIDAALEGIEPGLTEEQIRDIIDEALEGIETGITKEELEEIIQDLLNGQVDELIAGLAEGGDHALMGDVTLEDVVIPEGVTSTLNLNGYTLTVKGNWDVSGEFSANNGTIVFDKPYDEEELYMYEGIEVGEEGTLTLNGVEIIAKRLWNIVNCGETYLVDVIFTVNGGYGFSNKGDGAAVIDNCTFICNGDATSAIYCLGGTVDVYDSEFVEGTDFVEYYYNSPIEAHYYGVVTLDNSTVTTSGAYSVFAGTNGIVVINGGSLNNKVLCVGDDTSVTVYDGTINGVAFEDITAESDIFDGADFKLTEGANSWVISK